MAAVADGTVWVGPREGHGGNGIFGIHETVPADPNNPGTPDYWAYCIEHNVSAKTRLEGRVGDASSYLGSNLFKSDPAVYGKVLWVLAHSYPALSLSDFADAANVPGISRNDAIEATQYAIWRYTDLGFDADWNWAGTDSVENTKAAYQYLIAGANASSGLTPADFEATVSITAPSGAFEPGDLVGPFTVHTNRPTASVSVDPAITLTNAAGEAIDPNAVTDGQELYLDLRSATESGSATVTAAVTGSSASGSVISVPTSAGGTPTAADHAQSIILIAPDTARTTAQATASWTATPVALPAIGTSLVDAADGDRIVAWDGGTVIDTVAYANLTPGQQYTLTGELMRKSDGSATGITGSTTFTPTSASGTVEVSFTIPRGYAGETLVAFERLYAGSEVGGTPVAAHEDIDDAAQTVVVAQAPATTPAKPAAPTAKPAAELARTGGGPASALAATALLAVLAGSALLVARRRAV
ncbi:VaFE repeat-containing surface-anchored protein [Leucobacter ruminantium]|uniref:VaFE repeat-containing surface-anchored protein n=1 Tax=Leucobacter ruminantium TaxID=1289170 RepID=A0A939LU38_9MICO|nr:VaFE repeat-containing surface-anchored protein [Leucobacter ruminantium]MBO1804854.1 VaFE repeat-containing surface-anchored protein [Leucobacter ruminantium]